MTTSEELAAPIAPSGDSAPAGLRRRSGRARPAGALRAPALRLAVEAARVDPAGTILLGTALLASSVVPVGLAILSGLLVEALPRSFGPGRDGMAHQQLVAGIAGIGVLFLIQQVLPPVALAVAERVGRRVNRQLCDRMLRALHAPVTTDVLERTSVRDRVAAVNGGLGAASARDGIVGLVNVGIARTGALIGLLLLLPYRWWLALLLAGGYLLVLSRISATYTAGLQSAEGRPARLRRASYLRELAATAGAAKDVRVFGLTERLRRRYRAEWQQAVDGERGGGRASASRTALGSGVLVLAVQATGLVLLTLDLLHGDLSAGRFTMYAVILVGLGGALALSPDLLNISVAAAKLTVLAELEDELAAEPALPRSAEPSPRAGRRLAGGAPNADPGPPECRLELRHEVVFDRISFAYPGTRGPVLRDFDLVLRAGESTAIVGVNGAGKSTVVKLLSGLCRPTSGRILIDGIELTDATRPSWQRRCAVLSQQWLRWGLSIRENVTWGAPDRPVDDQVLAEVAALAGLDAIVSQLPSGWETPLSRAFGGVDLSGGQWQRVGLARALYARTAGGVLIMDEPTSALDVRGEAEVNERLMASAAASTVVLVSHRFAAVRRADRIVVLDGGRVVEQGGHAELRAAGGRYDAMFRIQAERYAAGGESA